MQFKSTLLFILAGFALVLSSACGVVEQNSCTEIGCQDQLRIDVVDADGEAVEVFDGEATFDGETIQFACDANALGGDGYHCSGDGSLHIQSSPAEVDLTISADELSATEMLTPEYEEARPNGEGCPPVCAQTNETVVVE